MMTMRWGSHTRAAPISRKLLRTRSAFSWDMARSMEPTTTWSGETESRPQARARIFSARVMGGRSAGIFHLLDQGGKFMLEAAVFRQADECGVLLKAGGPMSLAGQNAGGRIV